MSDDLPIDVETWARAWVSKRLEGFAKCREACMEKEFEGDATPQDTEAALEAYRQEVDEAFQALDDDKRQAVIEAPDRMEKAGWDPTQVYLARKWFQPCSLEGR